MKYGVKKEQLEEETEDAVCRPSHYNFGEIEVITVIDDWNLGFNLGNAIKYIARSEHKGKKIEDLEKAMQYLKFEIQKEQREPEVIS